MFCISLCGPRTKTFGDLCLKEPKKNANTQTKDMEKQQQRQQQQHQKQQPIILNEARQQAAM